MAVTIDTSFASPSAEDYADDDHFDLEDGSRSCRSIAASSFVRKLYDMVERESDEIIGWLPDGMCFEVGTSWTALAYIFVCCDVIPSCALYSLR